MEGRRRRRRGGANISNKRRKKGALNHVRWRNYLTVEQLPLQQLAAAPVQPEIAN